MFKWMRAATTILILLWATQVNAADVARPVFVPGEILVKFRDSPETLRSRPVMTQHGLTMLRKLRSTGTILAALDANADPITMAASLRELPEVEYAEPNYYRYIDAIPGDPGFAGMYGLHNTGQTGGSVDADIDAPEAWDIEIGSPDVVVAVIDSGIDVDHPDLVANLWVNPGEIPGNGIDDDANGFIDDIHGWDFVDNDNFPNDTSSACDGHGTHTAGTVGAVGDNGIGVSGVAQIVSIMALRTFDTQFGIFCSADDAALIDAIAYVSRMGVPISNNSWGGGPASQVMAKAIAASRHLFVSSAGNESNNNDTNPAYPATYKIDEIVSVAATDHNDNLAGFSNFGVNSVDLAAPGVNIVSTLLQANYGKLSGTSMAAPHVAGAAAVLLAADPTATALELRYRLEQGADNKGLAVTTGGRLNLHTALTLPASLVTIDVEPVFTTALAAGDEFDVDITVTNNSADTETVTAVLYVWAPSGNKLNLAGPASLVLQSGEVFVRTLAGSVPLTAPAGNYPVIGQVKNLPDEIFDQDDVLYVVE